MTNLAKLLAATTGIGSLAAPAAAQYQYPQQQYPQYQQQYQYPQQYQQTYPGYGSQQAYGYNNGGAIGQIIDQLLGNRYSVTDRQAVRQCATAAIAQAQSQYRGYGQGNYGYNQGNNGYDQGYNRGYGQAMRVTAITDVQRRSSGLRVKGLISTGYAGNRGYGGNGGGYQNQGYARGDLSFRCNVDYRGAVSNVRLSSNDGYRNY